MDNFIEAEWSDGVECQGHIDGRFSVTVMFLLLADDFGTKE